MQMTSSEIDTFLFCLHARYIKYVFRWLVWSMVLNATFDMISGVSWWSVLLVQGTRGVHGKKQPTCRRSLTNLSHDVVSNF